MELKTGLLLFYLLGCLLVLVMLLLTRKEDKPYFGIGNCLFTCSLSWIVFIVMFMMYRDDKKESRYIKGADKPGTTTLSQSAYAVFKKGVWHNTHPDAKKMVIIERKKETEK